MKTLRPFFSYFGGKWRIAKRYPAPVHETLVEPFAGSAGYSLRYPDRSVVLVEAYEPVALLWRYLIAAKPQEIEALPDIAPGENIDDPKFSLSPAEKYLIGFWLNAGTSRPSKTPSGWMRTYTPGSEVFSSQLWWGPRVRARVAEQLPAIRHWSVVHESYSDMDWDIAATWFVDPPYQQAGKDYPLGAKSIDFDHLAQWCRNRKGQTIVCEAEGATWLPFEPFIDAKASSGRYRRGKSREAVWLNV